MTLLVRQIAAVVTADITYKGAYFEVEEHVAEGGLVTQTALIRDRYQDTIIRALTGATTESADGVITRVVGVDEQGVIQIWRAVKSCARCSSPAEYATPLYDVPL